MFSDCPLFFFFFGGGGGVLRQIVGGLLSFAAFGLHLLQTLP